MDYPINTTDLQAFVDAASPTREQMRQDLARATGRYLEDDDGTITCANPFTNHADCHALVCWLAGQGNVTCSLFWGELDIMLPFKLTRSPLDYLTADPAVIAEAAWRAIQPAPNKNAPANLA